MFVARRTVFITVIFFALCSPLGADEIRHVNFVDQVVNTAGQTNYLFRGGTPDILPYYVFDCVALRAALAAAAHKAGFELPEKYFLVDISFLNLYKPKYQNSTLSEWTFFKEHPAQGAFILWEVLGTFENATDLPSVMRKDLVRRLDNWFNGPLLLRVEQLHEMLISRVDPRGLSTVFYGHCSCGCDRTGEVMGSYAMRWLGLTWQQVNEWNAVIAARPMGCTHYLSMQWYCLWLNQRYARHLDCINNYPCRPKDVGE